MTIIASQAPSNDEEESAPTVPTLSSGLLGIRRPAGVVNDLLWTNLILGSEQVLSSPTKEGLTEIAYRVHGKSAWSLGASLRDAEALDGLVKLRQLGPLWTGAVHNPYLRLDTLEYMLGSNVMPAEAISVAKARQDLHKLIGSMEENEHWVDIVGTLLKVGDALAIARVWKTFPEGRETLLDALKAFAPIREIEAEDEEKAEAAFEDAKKALNRLLHLREAFLVTLDEMGEQTDSIKEQLLLEAETVDAYLLEWLKDSESFEAQMSRALVFPDNGIDNSDIGKKLAKRLSEDTAWWALEMAGLVDLVRWSPTAAGYTAHWRTNVPEPLKPEAAQKRAQKAREQRQQLMLFKVTAAPSDIAPMMLTASCALDDDEIMDLIVTAGTTYIAEFLAGAKPVRPGTGDVETVWRKLNTDQREKVYHVLKDHTHLGQLPWGSELTLAVPGLLAKGMDGPVLWAANRILTERFRENVPAWETAIALLSDWTGSFDELTDAVDAIVPDENRSRVRGLRIEEVSKMLYGPDAEKDLETGAEE